jgi:uncharacterized protein (DUF305 family)
MSLVNRRNLALTLLAGAALAAGCAGGSEDEGGAPAAQPAPNIVQPGAPGEPTRTLTPEELEQLPQTTYTPADVDFMQGMIDHHAQALRMTGLVPARGRSRDVRLLAKRMELSQETEIDQIRDWLIERGEDAPTANRKTGHAHGSDGTLMPGMLTEAELKRLEAARGTGFDRLFLRSMIRHHEGALQMVAELEAASGGAEAAINAFVRHVDSDQRIEIGRMQQTLEALAAER